MWLSCSAFPDNVSPAAAFFHDGEEPALPLDEGEFIIVIISKAQKY